MQFLFDESDEMGSHKGMGLIPGRVTRFPEKLTIDNSQLPIVNLKVPHMGWNQLEFDTPHPLLTNVEPGSHTYFVHSYHCIPENAGDVVATADYGGPFTAIVGRDNVYGLQFHPEKSQSVGLQIIRNYMEAV
jgi:glutamine amidotransferase